MALFDIILKTFMVNMNKQIFKLPKYVLLLADTFREPLRYRKNFATLSLFYTLPQSCIK